MSATFNVSEFDRTVKEFYEGNHAEMQAAQKTLTNFQHDLNSWQVVDQILEQSSYLQTKVDNKQKRKEKHSYLRQPKVYSAQYI